MPEDNSKDAFDKVKNGLKKTEEGVNEDVKDSAERIGETASVATDKDPSTRLYEQTENAQYNSAKDSDKEHLAKNAENLKEARQNLGYKAENVANAAKSSEIAKKTGAGARALFGNPIVILFIIAAIILVVVLLLFNSGNQSKMENFNALWNQSLAGLRSGNMTVGEYCVEPVHDEDFCSRLKDLEYMN